jgi:hypothetical protein
MARNCGTVSALAVEDPVTAGLLRNPRSETVGARDRPVCNVAGRASAPVMTTLAKIGALEAWLTSSNRR